MTPLFLILLISATSWYSVVWLPKYFGLFGLAHACFMISCAIGVVATLILWRRTGASNAFTVGFGILGGCIGLFWPALEVMLQSIDGGSLPLYSNIVFGLSAISSIAALVGCAMSLLQGGSSRRWLIAAAVGTAVAGIFAPEVPPSARPELVLGLPFLVSGVITSFLPQSRPI